ncbi:MAG: M48 family metallopeptidase [Janthinobacterium lividum]
MPRFPAAAPRRETVFHQGQPLDYTLVFRARRTIGFAVRPDGTVHVSAPAGVPADWVAAQVLKRADWIRQHLADFARRPPPAPARRYHAGSSHHYLGRPLALRLAEGPRPAVAVAGNELVITYPAPHAPARTEAVLHAWYARQAPALFAASLARVWPAFEGLNLPRPTLYVRHMRTRWGSCTPTTARIRLTPDLVRATPGCLDYVLLHECCHLQVPDHSPAFYALQTRLLPDWELWKQRLNALPK